MDVRPVDHRRTSVSPAHLLDKPTFAPRPSVIAIRMGRARPAAPRTERHRNAPATNSQRRQTTVGLVNHEGDPLMRRILTAALLAALFTAAAIPAGASAKGLKDKRF